MDDSPPSDRNVVQYFTSLFLGQIALGGFPGHLLPFPDKTPAPRYGLLAWSIESNVYHSAT